MPITMATMLHHSRLYRRPAAAAAAADATGLRKTEAGVIW